jgi:MoaA/NifB/PqqE/SkfB family radical SAM enzyme
MPLEEAVKSAAAGHLQRLAGGKRSRMCGWEFDIETLGRALRAEVMPNPSIDLGNPCNLNCAYCFVEEKLSPRKLRRPDELSIQETRAVIEDFRRAGALTVNIVGAGEPTIDPHFEEVVELISSLGMVAIVFTNGIRIAREPALARFLYSRQATVVIKLNSRDPRLQDLVAGRPGYTRQRDLALELLLDAGFAAHSPTRLGADTMVFRGNLAELPALYRWCLVMNVHPIIGEYIPTGRTEGGRFAGQASLGALPMGPRGEVEEALKSISPGERLRLSGQLTAVNTDLGLEGGGPCAYFGGSPCTQILGVYVDISGNIWPCVARSEEEEGRLLPRVLGKVRDGDLPSVVWSTNTYLKRRRTLFDGGCPYKPAPLPERPYLPRGSFQRAP